MKKMFASLLMVLGMSAAVCAVEVSEIAEKSLANVQTGTITMKGEDGWLYSRNELSHLANEGRIVESGKHDELIELNGAYKRLHDLQLI